MVHVDGLQVSQAFTTDTFSGVTCNYTLVTGEWVGTARWASMHQACLKWHKCVVHKLRCHDWPPSGQCNTRRHKTPT
jgi:hypothetical protein